MSVGGKRAGAGRPKGKVSRFSQTLVEGAKATGLLPHEILLSVARGHPIEQKRWAITYDKNGKEKTRELITEVIYPAPELRVECAKAAAPYYAPRLAAHVIGTVKLTKLDPQKLKTMPDKKIDDFVQLMERLGVKKDQSQREPITVEGEE